jgi:hypothetical protein
MEHSVSRELLFTFISYLLVDGAVFDTIIETSLPYHKIVKGGKDYD